jgi:PTS system nitrogen regulatory IIA component
MKLASALSTDAVFPRLRGTTKKQVLKELSGYAETLTNVDAAEIFSVLMEREQAGVTAVGEGAAIPQARLETLEKTCILAATLDRPVEFGAIDGLPVDILVVLLTQANANTEHVKAVAAISHLLRDKQVCQAIRAAETPEDLYGVLTHVR